MKRILALLQLSMLGAVVTACSDATGPHAEVHVEVTPDHMILRTGDTVQLQVTVLDGAGRPVADAEVVWSSGNEAMATVDSVGRVVAVGAALGSVGIIATHGEASGAAILNVVLGLASVHPGGGHTCGLTRSGIAYCWGYALSGQTGLEGPNMCPGYGWSVPCSLTPAPVAGHAAYSMVNTGSGHSCGLTHAGDIHCWGSGSYGQLGLGDTDNRYQPTEIESDIKYSLVRTAFAHTLAITASGTAHAWGLGDGGVLGNGSQDDTHSPTAVAGGLTFVAVSGGGELSCGLTVDGTAYCWGYGEFGALGAVGTDTCRHHSSGRDTPCSTIPIAVSGGLTFDTVDAGSAHACGLSNGTAYCWGENFGGQLGSSTSDSSYVPIHVTGGLTFISITAGYRYTCGIATDHRAYCWGDNDRGQLGNGSYMTYEESPQLVVGGLRFDYLEAGVHHTCGVTVDGKTYCWGSNSYGGLGDGSTTSRFVPTLVYGQGPS